MPSNPPSACHRCGVRGCEQHTGQDERPFSAARRGYDRQWRRFRLAVLAEDPLCRFCLERGQYTPAEHVDHIIPLRERPDLRLVRTNCRGLCQTCHNRRKDSERRE